MNRDILTLKIVSDCVRETEPYLADTDLTAQVAAAGRQAGERLAADSDFDPKTLEAFLTGVVGTDDFAERLAETDPHGESIDNEPEVVGELLAEFAAGEPVADQLPEIEWSGVATAFAEALKRELVSTERVGSEASTSLWSLGTSALKHGDFDTAESYLELSLGIGIALNDNAAKAETLAKLGDGALRSGNPDVAKEYYEQSLDIAQDLADRATQATSLAGLGNVALQRDELDAAEEYHRASLDISRELGDRSAEANSLASLGTIAASREDFDSADAYLQESLDLKQLVDDRSGEATTLATLGNVAESRGEYETAIDHYTDALDQFTSTDQLRERLNALQGLTACENQRGNRGPAIDHCEQALELLSDSEYLADDQHRDWFRTTHAQLTRDAGGIPPLYEAALDRIQDGDDPAAFRLLHGIWGCRDAFETGTESRGLCLRAGVAFAAYHLLLETDTVETTHQSICAEINSEQEALSEPAAILFEFADGEGGDRSLEITTAGVTGETLDGHERLAYAAFLDRISQSPPPEELYTSVVAGIVGNDQEVIETVQLALAAWEQRDDDPTRAVLGAGLFAEAYRDAFGVDISTDQQSVFDFVADHRATLSEPLAALFDRLATGSTETTAEAILDGADRDQPSVDDVERMAVARFLEQLEG